MTKQAALATLTRGIHRGNPAWAQLLGLCPLLAVSNSVANALGLAIASTFVLLGATVCVSLLRKGIPAHTRLPVFMLLIATFTTCAVLLLEAFAFDLYQRIALFVQIIVTNCMILGRIETFASQQPPWRSLLDALGTSIGFAVALLVLGSARELLSSGRLGDNLGPLLGLDETGGWQLWPPEYGLLLAQLAPGAFLTAALLLALGQGIGQAQARRQQRNALIQTDAK